MRLKIIAALFAVVMVSACSSMATITSPNTGTMVVLRDETLVLPAKQNIKGTSFGNYEFKATDPTSSEPLYGILPLQMKGGHMAADILLFAPAMFFNLRGAFAYYEIDARNGVIRYKNAAGDSWNEYKPKPEEAARARSYFDGAQPMVPAKR
jgi:hypothetical protein